MSLGPIGEYERKTVDLVKAVSQIYSDLRDMANYGEDWVVLAWGRNHCIHEDLDDAQQKGSIAPIIISGLASKLTHCHNLLTFYHIAILHRDELLAYEKHVLALEIIYYEQVLAEVDSAIAELRRQAGHTDSTSRTSRTSERDAARSTFDDLMNKFTDGRWKP